MNLQSELETIKTQAKAYKFGKITVTAKIVPGMKVGYAGGASKGATVQGYIVIDSRFVEYCENHPEELINTLKHELAHLIAETTKSDRKKKPVWHGAAWKEIHQALGGNGERYYTGSFVKPENKNKTFKTLEELRKIKPTLPATDWERGTFRQWLERGYHVIKGQHGQPVTWEFSAEEYETTTDGKTSKWGRAHAVYFTPEQVEANQ